nr:hypothetical protein [Brucella anthropi]
MMSPLSLTVISGLAGGLIGAGVLAVIISAFVRRHHMKRRAALRAEANPCGKGLKEAEEYSGAAPTCKYCHGREGQFVRIPMNRTRG